MPKVAAGRTASSNRLRNGVPRFIGFEKRIAEFLGGCPVLVSEGKLFPVEALHLPAQGREPLDQHVARGVETALARASGDVLAFLPGVGEIRRAGEALAPIARQGVTRRTLNAQDNFLPLG